MDIGRIVVLNGASSAGKTSIARELQRMLPVAYLHVQLDAFRAMEPPGYFEGIAPELRKLRVLTIVGYVALRQRILTGECTEQSMI